MRIRIEPGGFATLNGTAVVNASAFERTYCLRRRVFEPHAQAVSEAIGQGQAFNRVRSKTVGKRRNVAR